MDVLQLLADVVVGSLIALAYLLSWVAWLTLGILPFLLAGLLYLVGRYGVPAVLAACSRQGQETWNSLRQLTRDVARHIVPRHA